jgi:hypothetical protein
MRCITAAAGKDGKLHARDTAVNPWSQGFLQKLVVDQLKRQFLALLYNPEVHDRVHNSLPFDPIYIFFICLFSRFSTSSCAH